MDPKKYFLLDYFAPIDSKLQHLVPVSGGGGVDLRILIDFKGFLRIFRGCMASRIIFKSYNDAY